jgi:heme exporter protein C
MLKRLTLKKSIPVLNITAGTMMLVLLFTIFFFAPNELTMGNVQRLFYFHVGSAWTAAITFLVALVAGILYLRRPSKVLDTISLASVEIGIVFTTMTIISGSVWGRPAWNTWWDWDSPRLISITVMWLVYVAYLMLRNAIEDEERRGRFAAVYVIAAFVTVIMTYASVRILRDIHPVVFGGTLESARGLEEGLQEFAPGLDDAKMGITLTVSVITFTLIYLAWLANRINLQQMVDEAAVLKSRVIARLQG